MAGVAGGGGSITLDFSSTTEQLVPWMVGPNGKAVYYKKYVSASLTNNAVVVSDQCDAIVSQYGGFINTGDGHELTVPWQPANEVFVFRQTTAGGDQYKLLLTAVGAWAGMAGWIALFYEKS